MLSVYGSYRDNGIWIVTRVHAGIHNIIWLNCGGYHCLNENVPNLRIRRRLSNEQAKNEFNEEKERRRIKSSDTNNPQDSDTRETDPDDGSSAPEIAEQSNVAATPEPSETSGPVKSSTTEMVSKRSLFNRRLQILRQWQMILKLLLWRLS